ncbi:MAG TPA: hypothetical protein IGS17_07180 [Oscillatoriales cyanobacterium M59_W2019_021]|nr:hypothetical protein [Oscillatoriales cyanobacterium M59_W2019_021]
MWQHRQIVDVARIQPAATHRGCWQRCRRSRVCGSIGKLWTWREFNPPPRTEEIWLFRQELP